MLARTAALLLRRSQQSAATVQLTRTFAAAATGAKAADTKIDFKLPTAPLQLSGTSASIATLVWQVAAKENALEQVQADLQQMAEAFTTQENLLRLATDPFVPAIVRKKVVEAVLKDSPAHEITKRLFEALADENGLSGILQIVNAYDELILAHKKEVYVTIVTAEPLDKMEKGEIRKQAEKFVEPGFKLVTKEKVDKKILGGFILEFEDRLVDLSTSKKVSEFNSFVTKLENDLK